MLELLCLNKIKKSIKDGKIPPELVINWDQTGVKVVPASQWTMEERGAPRVEIAGEEDKRQITLAGTLSAERCHPTTADHFPSGCDIWHTPNHWANSETGIRFEKNNIIPCYRDTKET